MFKTILAVAPIAIGAQFAVASESILHQHDAVNAPGQSEIVEREIVPCEQFFVRNEEGSRDAFRLQIWPGGVIPYEFDPNVNATNQARAMNAMNEIMEVCNATFVPRTTEPDRIVFTDSNSNNSLVGRAGGPQRVNIVNWNIRFIIVHEIMHAMGCYHEQSRPDRDSFVQINVANIQPGALNNFQIAPLAAPEGPYDFDSIMHYGQFDFTINGQRTITVLPPNEDQQAQIGQRTHLSDGDVIGLVARYGSPILGDINGDNAVDSTDLAILLAAWGGDEVDFNGDGVTDSGDLAILLAGWTG